MSSKRHVVWSATTPAHRAPMHYTEANRIAAMLTAAWQPEAATRAALALRAAGVTSHDLWRFGKTAAARRIPDYWANNTFNALQTLERD